MGGAWDGEGPRENGSRSGPVMVWKAQGPQGGEIRVVSFSTFLTTMTGLVGIGFTVLAFISGMDAGAEELAARILKQVEDKQAAAERVLAERDRGLETRLNGIERTLNDLRDWELKHLERHAEERRR